MERDQCRADLERRLSLYRLQAIQSSERSGDGKQAVLYTWLAALLMTREDWQNATDAALTVVTLDPLQPLSLLRLATCYEERGDHIKAHDYLERAVTLLPVMERSPHRARLSRLEILSRLQKADPIRVLPLEVFIDVMKHGLKHDPLFVLKASWTSRGWRETLNNSCPELWGTMSFPHVYYGGEQKLEEMARVWIQRSRGRLHTIALDTYGIDLFKRNAESYYPLFAFAKRFRLKDGEPDIREMANAFDGACENLEHLVLTAYERDERASEGPPFRNLDCGFPKVSTPEKIQSIRLTNIDFRQPDQGPEDSVPSSYPALKYLISDECRYDEVPRPQPSAGGNGLRDEIERTDPLHRALRTALNQSPCLSAMSSFTEHLSGNDGQDGQNGTEYRLPDPLTAEAVRLAIAHVLQKNEPLDADALSVRAKDVSLRFTQWSQNRAKQVLDGKPYVDHNEKIFVGEVSLLGDELWELYMACRKEASDRPESRLEIAKRALAYFEAETEGILGLGEDGISVGTGPSDTSRSQGPSRNDTGSTGASREPTQ